MVPEIGTCCWSRRRYWAYGSSGALKLQLSIDWGWIGTVDELVIRKANHLYHCRGCGRVISKGSIHAGGSAYFQLSDHYCLGCVTLKNPGTEYRSEQPAAVETSDPVWSSELAPAEMPDQEADRAA